MVPTLGGRIQTRMAVLTVVGSLWFLMITPLLPQEAPLGTKYEGSFLVLGLVMALGVAWELVYHGLQQFRWEKDWPALFGLITGVPEGLVAWLVLRQAIPRALPEPNRLSYVIGFSTLWMIAWLFVNGPMRVPLVHWRFRGGRIV